MIAAISRFRIANGTEQEVEAAFRARPRLVDSTPGFLGMETFTDSEDTTVFHLFTRWTDVASFRSWHGSMAHKESHKGIPKGIKLDAAYTQVVVLDRLQEIAPGGVWRESVMDAAPFLAGYLRDSDGIYCIFADMSGTVQMANRAAASLWNTSTEATVGLCIWDRLPVQDADRLRGWLGNAPAEEGPVLINFIDHHGHPLTLECRIEVRPDSFTLIGEQSRRDHGLLRDTLMQLNSELAVITRERERTARELRRANERVEASLEDLSKSHWHLRKMQEVLPICLGCGQVRTVGHGWGEIIEYIKENAQFLSHTYCPSCEAAAEREMDDRSVS